MKVTTEEVVLYFKCEEFERMPVKREPQELVFDSASTLYIGQAGPLIKGNFDVSVFIFTPSMTDRREEFQNSKCIELSQ